MVYLYKKKVPELNDIVIATVQEINDLNVITVLPDYNNKTGYISYAELSKKKRYNVGKIVTVGKNIITMVTGINNDKNYVELSVRVLHVSDIENFQKDHKKYVSLYNLWRYVYLKLNPDLNMDLKNINIDDLTSFMNNTLWRIEDKMENYTVETALSTLLDSEINNDILFLVKGQDINNIKNIIDEYITIKTVTVKPTKDIEIKLSSYEINGSSDIKTSLDYKSFSFYNDIEQDYDIEITYLSDSVYRINIKQIDSILQNNSYNIEKVYDDLINEIKNRCSTYKAILKI